jgi:chromosome partitioning protein
MIISFVHHKGGTGKTTSCISIAGYLALMDKKVLVIDLDPQANATSGLGIEINSIKNSMYQVLKGKAGIKEVITETLVDNIHLAPAHYDLIKCASILNKKNATKLDKALESVKDEYDFILIDTPPKNGYFTGGSVIASDIVTAVLDPSIYSIECLNSLQAPFKEYALITGKEMGISMVLLTKHQKSKVPFKKSPSQIIENALNDAHPLIFKIPYSKHIFNSQLE